MFYGERTNDYPKSSCLDIGKFQSTGRCLQVCGNTLDMLIMISHNMETHACMCCDDITGSDIIGSNWKTYIPPPCGDHYATYDLFSFQMCLKYVGVDDTYPSAVANCEAERSSVIKIDSQEKFDIFKDYVVPIANNTLTQVWVQGEKTGQEWQFHDGSPMPGFCPISTSNGPTEIRLRARGTTSFTCYDAPETSTYHYLCEHYRVLAISN
uniref:Uncharacterized protein n=1 Tax=Magallana gigas TaxID=29159 RepID=K1PL19_MAGGI|eukprot:XP_011418727.2 PREDICTED: uncharacterized protein LOC105321934 [Crassostrea gigas]